MTETPAPTDTTPASGTTAAPAWFYVIAGIALVWYLMDTSAFVMRVAMTEQMILGLPENQRHLYENIPLWVNAAFACEVFGGVVGCFGLLLKRRWALLLFGISLLGVAVQTSNIWFLTDAVATMGAAAVVMPVVAMLIGVVMIAVTKISNGKGWLR